MALKEHEGARGRKGRNWLRPVLLGLFSGQQSCAPKAGVAGAGSRASGGCSQEFSASPFAQTLLCPVIQTASEAPVPVASGCSAEQEVPSWRSHLTSSANGLCVITAAVGFSSEALCLWSGLMCVRLE